MMLSLVAAPRETAVSLEEAKEHLTVDHFEHDDLITSFIKTATARLDGPSGRLGRPLLSQM